MSGDAASPPPAQGPRRALRLDDVFPADLCGRLLAAAVDDRADHPLTDPLLLGATATAIGQRVLPPIRAAFGARLTRITTPRLAHFQPRSSARVHLGAFEDLAFSVWAALGSGGPRWRLPGHPPFALPPGAALVTPPGVDAELATPGTTTTVVLHARLLDEASLRASTAADSLRRT